MSSFPVPELAGVHLELGPNAVSDDAQNENARASGIALRHLFPRSARLLRHADFEQVYKQGQRHFAAHMTVFYLQRQHGGMRVGFTVGRQLGGAVVRNRMKRRLREAVRLQEARPVAAVDVVINPKKSLLTAEFDQLQKEVSQAFQAIERKLAQKRTN